MSTAVAPGSPRCVRCGGSLVVASAWEHNARLAAVCLARGHSEPIRHVLPKPQQRRIRCGCCNQQVESPYTVVVGGEVRRLCGGCAIGVRA